MNVYFHDVCDSQLLSSTLIWFLWQSTLYWSIVNSSNQWRRLVILRSCQVASCLCHNACKRSPAICRKNRASYPGTSSLSFCGLHVMSRDINMMQSIHLVYGNIYRFKLIEFARIKTCLYDIHVWVLDICYFCLENHVFCSQVFMNFTGEKWTDGCRGPNVLIENHFYITKMCSSFSN